METTFRMELDKEGVPLMARRLRQVVDLYSTGKVVPLRDGSLVWVQPLNPFEQDTARNEAQIAKARLTLALKEFGGDEQAKVRVFFFEEGPEGAVNQLVDAKVAENMAKVIDSIRNDPDWTEKLQIVERGLDDTAKPAEPIERELVEKYATEFSVEMGRRLSAERDFQHLRYAEASEEVLWADYLAWYIDRRTAEVMMAEFRVHQLFYGVRVCNASISDDGTYNHSLCNGHTEQLFYDKDEVRGCPEELQALLLDSFDDLELTVREAKNSRRQGSSSDSSPLPSEAEESTASTQTGTPAGPHGSSSSPSPTPSPSSAGTS